MIQFIRDTFSFKPYEYPHQKNLLSANTIMMIALGALAFVSAKAFDREAPALSTVLRFVPAGLGLVWLFKRYRTKKDSDNEPSPLFIHQPVSSPSYHFQPYIPQSLYPQTQPNYPKASIQTGFPAVTPAASQDSRFSRVKSEPTQTYTSSYSAPYSFWQGNTNHGENQRPIFEAMNQRPY